MYLNVFFSAYVNAEALECYACQYDDEKKQCSGEKPDLDKIPKM